MTRVSVVVPTRGGAGRLPRLLSALGRQSHDDWEAIVVVDGDVDGSGALVERESRDLPVRALVLPENRGRAAALNAGFGAATGDVLLRSDDDLDLTPEHLARHALHHEQASEPMGVVGLCRNIFAPSAYARAYGVRTDVRFRDAAYTEAPEQRWRYWGANVSVTAETWHLVGAYDETYRAYGWEDVDWGYRLHRLGLPISIEPDVEALHLGAAATSAERALRAFYSGAARQHFVTTHRADEVERLLPAPSGGSGVWGLLVTAVARLSSESRIAGLGAATDRASRVLPVPVAAKLVALLVEGAAVAGHRAGGVTGVI